MVTAAAMANHGGGGGGVVAAGGAKNALWRRMVQRTTSAAAAKEAKNTTREGSEDNGGSRKLYRYAHGGRQKIPAGLLLLQGCRCRSVNTYAWRCPVPYAPLLQLLLLLLRFDRHCRSRSGNNGDEAGSSARKKFREDWLF
jgi:hypothetical protein